MNRGLLSNWVLTSTDATYLKLWIMLLLNAAYKPTTRMYNGRLVQLMPGEVIFTRNHWADQAHVGPEKIRFMLDKFEKDGMITRKSAGNAYTIVKIVNWCAYQSEGGVYPFAGIAPTGQPAGTPTQHQPESLYHNAFGEFGTNEGTNELTNEATNGEPTIYKNSKNIKNTRNRSCGDESGSNASEPDPFDTFWTAYPRKIEKAKARKAWEARLKEKVSPVDMVQAAEHYSAYCERLKTEPQYIKHPSTFLGKDKPFMEYVQRMPEVAGSSVKTDTSKITNRNNFQSRSYDDQFFEKLGKMGS